MEELKQRILQDGQVLSDDILKVNSFLNHQIDPFLMKRIGEQFKRLFSTQKITKILTIEASGIAPALMTGLALNVPVVFARKSQSVLQDNHNYHAEVFSYTKKVTNHILVDCNFVDSNDNVLIIDDFLANGEAVNGLIKICQQADCSLAGIGIVIEKAFQKGGQQLREAGYHLESLVRIKFLANHQVTFMED